MKKVLFFISLSCIAMTTNAGLTKKEFCKDMSSYAELVMQKRQNNTSIKTMLQAIEQSGESKGTQELMESIVEGAYSMPAYSTKEFQDKSVNEYSASVYLECKRNLN